MVFPTNSKVAYLGGKEEDKIKILSRFWDYHGPIGVDVETVSLEDQTLLGAGFAINPQESYWFPVDSALFPWSILDDPGREKIFHNGGFDIKVLEDTQRNLKVSSFHDSCITAMLLGLPAKLSTLCLDLFERPERLITDILEKGQTMRDLPEEVVAERACLDAQDALEAWFQLNKDYPIPQDALALEEEFLPVALDIQRQGIRVDKKAIHEHKVRLEGKMDLLKAEVELDYGFNPGSTFQLAEYFRFLKLDYPIKKGNDGRYRPSLNKNILRRFYISMPAVQKTLEYRSTQTLLTHLIRKLDNGEFIEGDRIHPKMNLNVAQTGRITRSSPPTQNISHDLRNIVIPEDGEVMVSWDFSQIELREAADQWDDKVLKNLFSQGYDGHDATLKQMEDMGHGGLIQEVVRLTTFKNGRDVAKMINYLMMFQGDEVSIVERTGMPMDASKALIDAYFSSFQGMANGIEETKKFLKVNGYTQTRLGRRRDFTHILDEGEHFKVEEAERQGVNHPIQGTCAEYMKKALIVAHKDGIPTSHTVHDEGDFSAPVGYRFPGLSEDVTPFPAPIDVKYGPNWRDVKKP